MTLPDERLRSLYQARTLLEALMFPGETPRVPSKVRQWARRVLKHYPTDHELDRLGKGEVGLFTERKRR